MIMFTIRHTFESIEAAGSDLFSKPEKFYHYRDGFFEFFKYNILRGRISQEEAYSCIEEEPLLEDDILYAYAAAYTHWVANEMNVPVPAWVESDRAYKFSDCFIVSRPILHKNDERISNPPYEMYSRGFYIRDRDMQIV